MDNRRAPIRVLLVGDSSSDAERIAGLLYAPGEARFDMSRVTTLAAAMPIVRHDECDAVLFDPSVPDSAGLESLRELAAAFPHAPILVLAGTECRGLAVEAIRNGAQDCVLKSNRDPELLARSIRMAIERKSLESRLAKRAHFDPLTGLANRALFHDRLEHALARAKRSGGRAALLYADLDGFKAVNDTHGHAAGDEVLGLVAARFRSAVRASDTAARFGGDEFTVLIEPLRHDSAAESAAARILEVMRAPLPVAGRDTLVTASIGIALYPDHAADGAALLRGADTAMFRAKRAGRNCVRLFEPG